MSDNSPIMASSIAGGELAIWDKVFAERMDSIDLTQLLIYLVDIVPSDILPYLAEQYDVMGFKGWLFAKTDEEKRSVIKGAIERKKYSGTPWAVKEALKSVGYSEAQIREGINAIYNGFFTYDGTITYGSNSWALFDVHELDLGENKGFKNEDLSLLVNLINEYKRSITHLVNISFTANVADEQIMRGIIYLKLIDTDENVLEEYTGENLIVNIGRSNLAKLLAGESTDREVSKIGFGTNGTDPEVGNTELTEAFIKSIDGFEYPDTQSVKFNFTLDFTEANGKSIQEFGLVCEDDSLFSRKTRQVIEKTEDFKIEGSWTIIFE